MEDLFDRYSTGIYRYIFVRVGRNRALADELMQQLWLQGCKSGGAVPPDEFEFWLRRVAKNLISDHWRRKHRRPAGIPIENPAIADELATRIDSELLPANVAEKKELLDQVALAVTALPAADQELVVLHYVQGRPFGEIGERLGMSERAIEGRLYRARQKLKELLAHLEEAV
jgi:RNA polymerase sigma-70 factor (ECF subfamily)